MTLAELLSAWRSDVKDTATPYLWSDPDGIEYANDAVNEACRRARLITDSTTAACCTLTMTPLLSELAFHDSVIYVKEIVRSNGVPLAKQLRRDLDRTIPGWRTRTGDETLLWVPDMTSRTFRPYPTPATEQVFTATVVRTPLVPMVTPATDSPGIPSRYHRSLVHWMRFRAYSRKDSETYSPEDAESAQLSFAMEFGQPISAVEEQWMWERHDMEDEGGLP